MSGVSGIFVHETYYSNYQFTDKSYFAPTASLFYNYHKENFMQTSETYAYDAIGNVTGYTSIAGDEISAQIDYHEKGLLRNSPRSIAISSGGTQLRKRSSEIDDKGNITKLTVEGQGLVQDYNMEYDQYGNMTYFEGPQDGNGERMSFEIEYDPVLHRLPVKISDYFGYSSSTTYDYLWALPLSVTDINGETVEYTYDELGRLERPTPTSRT